RSSWRSPATPAGRPVPCRLLSEGKGPAAAVLGRQVESSAKKARTVDPACILLHATIRASSLLLLPRIGVLQLQDRARELMSKVLVLAGFSVVWGGFLIFLAKLILRAGS